MIKKIDTTNIGDSNDLAIANTLNALIDALVASGAVKLAEEATAPAEAEQAAPGANVPATDAPAA